MAGNQKKTGASGSFPEWKNGRGYEARMRATEETMTPAGKVRRQLFVAHYIETLNKKGSAEFAGFKSPASKGVLLCKEPYVQHLIKNALKRIDQDAIMSANEILFQAKKEALDDTDTNKSARIQALSLMAKMRGLLVEKHEVNTNNGGVMIVPGMVSPTEWSEMAAKSQEELKGTVRD
jgi:phage terminase small subunit